MTEESRTDFSSNQSRKPFFSPAYATNEERKNRSVSVSVFFSQFSFPGARALVLHKKTRIHPTLIQCVYLSTNFDE